MQGLGCHPMDPRDLIHEAYRIEGIGDEDCRSIFFDWAMGMDPRVEVTIAAVTLLADLAPDPNHPMTALLTQAAAKRPELARRRTRRRMGDSGV